MIISIHKRFLTSLSNGRPFSRTNKLVNTEHRTYQYSDFEIYCTVSTHKNPVVPGVLDNYAITLCGLLKK